MFKVDLAQTLPQHTGKMRVCQQKNYLFVRLAQRLMAKLAFVSAKLGERTLVSVCSFENVPVTRPRDLLVEGVEAAAKTIPFLLLVGCH